MIHDYSIDVITNQLGPKQKIGMLQKQELNSCKDLIIKKN